MMRQKELIRRKNWDHLIILDACRYDYFKVSYQDNFDGELVRVRSPGSTTPQWASNTFGHQDFGDTVYVDGSAALASGGTDWGFEGFNPEIIFHKLIDVFKLCQSDPPLHPKKLRKFGIIADLTYPDLNKIYHFMQPHRPFINYEGESEWKHSPEVYCLTLKWVLDEVEKLVNELEGKIVVTSDHGELIGLPVEELTEEQKKSMEKWNEEFSLKRSKWGCKRKDGELFGHPGGLDHSNVRCVPWLKVDE